MPREAVQYCEHGLSGPCLACAELALPPAEQPPAQPRVDDRSHTAADVVVYAIIALVMAFWLFAIDGGTGR